MIAFIAMWWPIDYFYLQIIDSFTLIHLSSSYTNQTWSVHVRILLLSQYIMEIKMLNIINIIVLFICICEIKHMKERGTYQVSVFFFDLSSRKYYAYYLCFFCSLFKRSEEIDRGSTFQNEQRCPLLVNIQMKFSDIDYKIGTRMLRFDELEQSHPFTF
jgi:hypothetical protein